ncbi:MAG: YgfZ/GcvT domain-containing protein [Rhizomicrobium sp.]
MSSSAVLTDRAILAVAGAESREFLQGLITNDIRKLSPDLALYAALLTPQGKLLFDFILYDAGSEILVDCADAEKLQGRLLLYRLRAKVEIALRSDLAVVVHWDGANPAAPAWRDPRCPPLGCRSITEAKAIALDSSAQDTYLAHRLDLGIPEGHDFGSDRTFALDAGLEELHGVAFDKGCYIGQELTARMKHRGTARKRLLPLDADATLPHPGTLVMAGDREVGSLTSVYETRGFALLRLDRLAEAADATLDAGGIPVRVRRPAWIAA